MNRVILYIIRQALTTVYALLQLGVGAVTSDNDRSGKPPVAW